MITFLAIENILLFNWRVNLTSAWWRM